MGFVRGLRASVVIAVLWAVPWALVGGGLFGVRYILLGNSRGGPRILGMTLTTAAIGAACGFVFGGVLAITGRKRKVEDIPAWPLVLTAAVLAFYAGTLLDPGYIPAVVFAATAAGCAGFTLALARRGTSKPSPPQ